MTRPTRIAVVAASAPPYSAGGVASAHYNLYQSLRNAGFDAKLFTFYDNGISASQDENIVRQGIHPKLADLIYSIVRLPFRLLQPKAASPESGVIIRSALGARKMNKSIMGFNPDIIMLSDHGAPGLFLDKLPHQRFIWFSHHNPARFVGEPLLGESSHLDAALALLLEQKALNKVDDVICTSTYVLEWFHQAYTFTGPVHLLPNLVDDKVIEPIAPYNPRNELGLSSADTLIYMPSAGTHIKGGQFLLQLIEKITGDPPRKVAFYVPGRFDPEISRHLDNLKIPAAIYTPGQVDYERHIGIVKSCTFCISPALMENFSMAIVEAAFCGLPVIAFDRGGNRDIIEDGENGRLIRPFDISAMKEVAVQWLTDSQFPAFKIRTKNYTRSRFASDVVLKAYMDKLGLSPQTKHNYV